MEQKHKRVRNPLNRRIWRELKDEAGKYIVIFLLLFLSIGLTSGYLVANGSMTAAYEESFEKYNVEDGHFRLQKAANRAQTGAMEKLGIRICPIFYHERSLTNGSTLRIYADRTDVDRLCLMEGALPSADDDIAVDRMYADNNGLSIGDTISDGVHTWRICGLVAFSDYSALFADNNDTMFDAVLFGTAAVTADAFDAMGTDGLNYCYAWKYDDPPADTTEEKELSDDLLDALSQEVVLQDFVPRYSNQAINYAGDDISGDMQIMEVLLYIIIVIMAMVFAITSGDTILREANVIGTLRASGYTRGEIVRHYMAMPVIVTLIGALLGNVAGYTFMKDVCASMYYGSYSLPTYVTIWNADAFVRTTLYPILIMLVVNGLMLTRKLRFSPLKFLRRDLSRRRNSRPFPLPKFLPFLSRFRFRVLLQNKGSYAMMLIGIIFANFLLCFGMIWVPLLDHYSETLQENMLANYQYVLDMPVEMTAESGHKLDSYIAGLKYMNGVETENEDAEKVSLYSLKLLRNGEPREDTLLYGVDPDSRYIHADFSDGRVYASSALADKFSLSVGDTVTLREEFGSDEYSFTIGGIYSYDGGLALFMDRSMLNRTLDWDDDMFTGYLSDTPIEDIDENYLGSVIDLNTLTKVSRQLKTSMGSLMYLVDGFAVIIFVVLIYLLTKVILEKNSQSISLCKILGYKNGEISGLYILSTTIAVVVFILLSLPLEDWLIRTIFRLYLTEAMNGWIPVWIDRAMYIKIAVIGIVTYAAVALLEMRKIRRVPMDSALKNVE